MVFGEIGLVKEVLNKTPKSIYFNILKNAL